MKTQNVKKFRHDIAVLKKKGLITGVDARSVKPTKRLETLVTRFDDVLSGKATPVKLPKSQTKNLKEAGYDVYKGRAIFPHSAGEKITVTHGRAVVRQPNGVERVQIPIPFDNLEKYIAQLRKKSEVLTAMKSRDEFFAFRFHGHQSHAVFRNIELLAEYLREYKSVDNAINSKSSKDMNEVYRNLEIVKVHRARDWKEQGERERKQRGDYSPVAYQRSKRRRKRNPAAKLEYDLKQAEKMREYRARLKKDPKKIAAYKKAAKKRAKKSRRKNAKKDSRSRS